MTDCSIVIPVYFNAESLRTVTHSILNDVVKKNPDKTYEIIFVDDGSGDHSLRELLLLHEQYPELITVVKFTRNFGQLSAIRAGLSFAKGACSIVMSADNQDPIELIPMMLRAHFHENYDIVICSREGRDESLFRIWTSKIFFNLIRKLSFPNMPSGGFDYILLSRRVAETILRNMEATAFFQGQILWTGYRAKFISYRRRKREFGESRWTFGKKLTYLIDGILAYSFFPIRVMSVLGLIVASLGFIYASVIFVVKIFWGLPIEGWAPLMIIILILGGVQMLMLGIIGEYLWRVLAQVRDREQYIIDSVFESHPAAESSKV